MHPTIAPHVRALLIAGLLLSASMSHAQQVCGTMERLQEETMANPQRAARQQALETFTRQWLAENGTSGARSIITIPVVFHVLWRTAEENVSDARLQAQLQQLNADFARQNTDAVQTPATFAGVAADTDIRFCLAQRDPDGHPTTGIIRRQTTFNELYYGNNDVFQTATGGSDAWPRASYLNIWVCDLGSGLFGYAQFPGGAAATDGIVLQNAVVGGFAAPGTLDGYQYGRTATHEVGHWLGLLHIWGDVACGNDLVDDTPVHFDANYGCPTHPHLSTCPGTSAEMFMNYMDYATDGCKNMFTAGQAARMQAVLASSISQRDQLAGSQGCLPPDGGSACAAPQGLVTSAVDQTTATVEWDAVDGATSYDVRYQPFGTGTWTTWTTAGTTLHLIDLVDATTYDWQVRANCTSGPSAFSDIVLFTTGNDDADGDGYPAGIDCDDTNASVYPGAPELCDGVDNNCDGQVDDGLVAGIIVIESEDGVSEGSAHVQVAVGGITLINGPVDIVSDPDQGVTLGQVNVCAPRGCLEVLVQETGLALYPEAYLRLLGVTETFIPFVFTSGTPVTVPTGALVEICGNGIDDDCDGEVDEGILWYTDADGDGFGDPATAQHSCTPIPGMVPTGGDCDDQDAAVFPGAAGSCDGIDNNCDGQVDEDFFWYADADGDGFGDPATAQPGCPPVGGVGNGDDCDDTDTGSYAIGQPCDDDDPGTHSDMVNGACQCVGIPVNNCPPGEIPDCNGNCAPAEWVGDMFCDDGSFEWNGIGISFHCPQFDNDGGDCNDADGDGYMAWEDCDDTDPGLTSWGQPCDDGDPGTHLDTMVDGCLCVGVPVGTCPEGEIMDCNGNCAPADLVGNGYCDEGLLWHGVPISFNCPEFGSDGGDCIDADGDGFPSTMDCNDDDPNLTWFFDPCDDGDPDTYNDIVTIDCTCRGVPFGSPCPYYGEVPDCNGNCVPSFWIGDGWCDGGDYDWNGNLINLNCAAFGFDGGDCGTPCPAEICGNGIDDDCDGEVDEGCEAMLQVRVFLEGPYDAATGLMHDGLRSLGLVPLVEPYTALGYVHVGGGGETTTSAVMAIPGHIAVVDWVVVELRAPFDPAAIVATRCGLLLRGGSVMTENLGHLEFPVPPGPYHVAVRHRNHLGVMTADPVALTGGLTTVDFTLGSTATFGTDASKALTGGSGTMVLWQGDVGGDERIQYTGSGNDRDRILQAIGGTIPTGTVIGYRAEDVNMDGVVKYTGEGNDRDPILQNVGGTVPTNVKEGTVP